jgi:hypothetical protein
VVIFLGAQCYEASSRLEVGETGITYHRLLGAERSMRWEEVDHITETFLGGRLDLYDTTSKVRIPIDYEIVGFLELVILISEKRPDLWSAERQPKMAHRNPFRQVVVGDDLELRHLFRRERVVRKEIKNVSLQLESGHGRHIAAVHLHLTDGRTINLSTYGESGVSLFFSLLHWLEDAD